MRYQSLALLAVVCSVVLAREDTAELCTGALSCDEGYCCSSHGFCGRSTLHCSNSSGCNPLKGTCGVVVYDGQDLPRVISYKELGQGSAKDLAVQLADQGSHVSPDELKSGITIQSILEGGLAEKEKMVASSNGDSARQGSDGLDIHALTPTNVVHLPSSASDSSERLGAILAENVSGDSNSKDDSKKATATPTDAKSDARRLTVSVAGTAALGAFAWLF
ncbi:hypothetical protein BGX24_000783 [Mortierella sp. AD032]|nr:hypothetical protein BGX24_000783 [Mortierella sp. AD032]